VNRQGGVHGEKRGNIATREEVRIKEERIEKKNRKRKPS
jgi:hypothetical protein